MKLRKSQDNVVISGVLGGIGEYYEVDPTIIRIGFVLLSFVNIFPLIPLYIIAALLMPESSPKKQEDAPHLKEEQRIDKSFINKHNVTEVKEDDWSDF